MAGILIASDDPGVLQRRYVFPSAQSSRGYYAETPIMVVTPQVADRLLAPAGGSLAQLDDLARAQAAGEIALTESDTRVRMDIPLVPEDKGEELTYVIGYIPGRGALMGEQEKVVMISAYYDGLGTGPDGTVYPGANDNASGVATMLEIARALKTSPAQPSKTIVFVAWSGGERHEGLSLAHVMNAKRGFHFLTAESVIELSGVGAGSGSGIALGSGTSFSLVQLFQEAAGRMGVSVTTRGRGPHFGMSTESGFGGRSALSAYVSWDGSDQTAHTAADAFQSIQADKVRSVGQTTLLVVSVLGRMEAQASLNGPLLPPNSYVEGARLFDEAAAVKHVKYLASDTLAGRRPGTPGGRAAGDYIAARFAEYGLQPAAPDGTYFQPFTVPYTTVVESPDLTVTFSGAQGRPPFVRTYSYPDDYLPRSRRLGSGEATGAVVWLNSCSASSFVGHDLAGKIGLCRAGPLQEDDHLIDLALKQRVGGLLFIASDMLSPLSRPSYAGGDTAPLPAFYVTDVIGQDLLIGTDYRLYQLNQLPPPVPLSTTVHMAAAIETHQVCARNVLGLLPGSDPERKDQIVVIGAHYDHLGTDPDGTVYNGANDNASGVAVLLEIARLWQAQGFSPARSVLFAAWDDEEQGGLGSVYYVRNPTRPLDRTVAMLELDMVGTGEEVYIVGREAVADQLEISTRVYSATVEFTPAVEGGDSRSFQAGGVPAALLSIVEGPGHASIYHRPEDDVVTIQPAALRAAGVLAAHTLAAWAGGGPTLPLPSAGPRRTLRDLMLPTPTCPAPWPIGAMTCDHGSWMR
jgi:Zn-dependent M28 family amino/carboxypeptidase